MEIESFLFLSFLPRSSHSIYAASHEFALVVDVEVWTLSEDDDA